MFIMFLLGPKESAILILICFLCFILYNQISKLYKVDHRAIINFFPVLARPIVSPTNIQFILPQSSFLILMYNFPIRAQLSLHHFSLLLQKIMVVAGKGII